MLRMATEHARIPRHQLHMCIDITWVIFGLTISDTYRDRVGEGTHVSMANQLIN